jgi:hypothetical protein
VTWLYDEDKCVPLTGEITTIYSHFQDPLKDGGCSFKILVKTKIKEDEMR